jgi:hypothetical protein
VATIGFGGDQEIRPRCTASAWHVGRPAIGVPGAKNWRDEWAEYLADIAKIFVLVEPDEAGKELWARLARCKAIADRLIKVGG